MKKLLIMASLLLSFNSFAQEMHSPQYKCSDISTGEIHHILLGNEFPQIPEIDWSEELRIVSPEQYVSGSVDSDRDFIIYTNNSSELSTYQNDFRVTAKLNLETMELVLVQNMTLIAKYNCIKQLGVY